MALIATGVGSGLDIEGLIGQLMAAERIPVEQRLIKRETEITQDISALGSLKGALSAFQSTLGSVNAIDTYEKRNASSSNASAVIVSATSDAAVGTYNLNVASLANAQSLAVRNQFSSVNEAVGTGTLTFTFGTTSYTADTSTPVNTANDTYDGFVEKAVQRQRRSPSTLLTTPFLVSETPLMQQISVYRQPLLTMAQVSGC